MAAHIWLLGFGSLVLMLLGSLHLLFTFHGRRLHPRDPELVARLKREHLVITRESSMWNAWLGFNASHSVGLVFLPGTYLLLATSQPKVIEAAPWLLLPLLAATVSYVVLAHRYWFKVPQLGAWLALLA
ncbi:MAG: hypothetical protein R3217_09555 [Gammaproteobacteria bacterium]|nr:hypothetical protein [Gammaproteobacteria bacterium]